MCSAAMFQGETLKIPIRWWARATGHKALLSSSSSSVLGNIVWTQWIFRWFLICSSFLCVSIQPFRLPNLTLISTDRDETETTARGFFLPFRSLRSGVCVMSDGFPLLLRYSHSYLCRAEFLKWAYRIFPKFLWFSINAAIMRLICLVPLAAYSSGQVRPAHQ